MLMPIAIISREASNAHVAKGFSEQVSNVKRASVKTRVRHDNMISLLEVSALN